MLNLKTNIMKIIRNILFALTLATILFSCSSSKQTAFTKRKYYHYKHGETEIALNKPVTKERKNTSIPAVAIEEANYTPVKSKTDVRNTSNTNTLNALNSEKENTNNAVRKTELSKGQLKKKIKQAIVSAKKYSYDRENPYKNTDRNNATNVGLIILAIILPPLAVYLYERGTKDHFWLSVLLTILFFFPGIVFAFMVIFGAV